MSVLTILRRTLLLFALALLVFQTGTAHAQLKFDLQPVGMDVKPGTAVTQSFTALLVNQYNVDVYITGDFFTSDSPLTIDDTKFQDAFFPLDANGDPLPLVALKAGDTLQVPIFDATMPAGATQGLYAGVFDITYGFDPTDMSSDVAASFFANVSNTTLVPEPGSMTLMTGMALTFFLFVRPRRRR